MKICAAKMILVFGCVLCLGTGPASTAEAGPFSDAIFGPSGSMSATPAGYTSTAYTTTSLYGPSGDGACCGGSTYGSYSSSYGSPYSASYGYSANYGASGGSCGSSCGNCCVRYGLFGRPRLCCRRSMFASYGLGSGCCGNTLAMGGDSCSPCGGGGCGPSGCATGQCGVTSGPMPSNGQLSPVPDSQGPPPTYKDQNPGDEFNKDQIDKGFQPKQGGGSYPPSGAQGPTPENVNGPPSVIPKKDPMPPLDGPAAENKTEGYRRPALSPLNLDGKVAWRPTVTRERSELSSSYTSVRVTRRPLYAKSTWVAPEEVEVAKK